MNTEDHILNIEHQLYKVHKDGYNSNFGCLLKGCVKNPIKSHLISKSQLKKISTNGFVYYPISGVGNGIDIKKRGINNSSIFNLFCIDHDNGLFKFIDEATQLDENLLDRKRKIEKIVKQICIQNMFKVSSMEYFKKKVSMGLFDKQKFRDLNSDQEMNFNMATSVYQYFTEEADFYRIKFEKIMLNQTQE